MSVSQPSSSCCFNESSPYAVTAVSKSQKRSAESPTIFSKSARYKRAAKDRANSVNPKLQSSITALLNSINWLG